MANLRYKDIGNIRVGYDYPKQSYYVTNKETTTYRSTQELIRDVLEALSITTTDVTDNELTTFRTQLEDLTNIYYTWEDTGLYIKTLQFNDWNSYPLVLDCHKSKLYIMNSTTIFNLDIDESLQMVVAPTLCSFYKDTLGLDIPFDTMLLLCKFLNNFYTPTVVNHIITREDTTTPLRYNNEFELTSFNNKALSTYTCYNNPYNNSTPTKIANITALTNSNQIVVSDLHLIDPKYNIEEGVKLSISGISEILEGTTYTADGTYTVQSIEDSTITVEETFPISYNYPFINLYANMAHYDITAMSRDNSTITVADTPDNILVGDKVIVVGADIPSTYETISLDREYTVQAIQGNTEVIGKGCTISNLVQNTNNTVSFTTPEAIGTVEENKITLNYTVTYETNEGTEEEPEIVEHSETYEHEYIVNSIEDTTVTVIGTLEGIDVQDPTITGNTITYKKVITTTNITVEEEIATNFAETGAILYKNKYIEPIKDIQGTTLTFLNTTTINLQNQEVMCYNSSMNIENTTYTVESMIPTTTVATTYTGAILNKEVEASMVDYPELLYPKPSEDILIEVTSTTNESVLPTGKFIVDDYGKANEYIGLLDNNIKPEDMSTDTYYSRNIKDNMYNFVADEIIIESRDKGIEITLELKGLYSEVYSESLT